MIILVFFSSLFSFFFDNVRPYFRTYYEHQNYFEKLKTIETWKLALQCSKPVRTFGVFLLKAGLSKTQT